jgi:hypothetical protein
MVISATTNKERKATGIHKTNISKLSPGAILTLSEAPYVGPGMKEKGIWIEADAPNEKGEQAIYLVTEEYRERG